MKSWATALLSGGLFGAGLAISEMTNPARVIGFLDITGEWDPTLAFVMGAALVVSFLSVQLAGRDGSAAAQPPASGIDASLLCGAALFGVGWGLAGLCPGPALAALISGSTDVILFVGAMVVGMAGFEIAQRYRRPPTHAA